MEKYRDRIRRFRAGRPVLCALCTAAVMLALAAAVTGCRHTFSKYYTGVWDGYSELTAVGRIVQVQQGWSGQSGFLGTYTDDWNDGEGYRWLKEPVKASDMDGYRAYVHQSGLQGSFFGALARLLRVINGEARLNALYFTASTLFYALAFWLCLALGRRLGPGAGLAAAACVVFSPWLTSGVKNLYWVLFTWLLPLAAGVGQCAFFRREGRFSRRWLALAFGAVLVRCLCGFEYISTLLILMEAPLVLAWAEDKPRRMAWLRQMVRTGLAGVGGVLAALLVWLGQCWHYYGSLAEALQCVLGTALARMGVEGAGVEVIQTGGELSRLDVILQFFLESGSVVSLGSLEVTLPPLAAAALAAALLVKALEKGEKPLSRALGWLLLLSAAAPASWMLLAKEHAALHAHLTPMLWNFALVPACGAALGCAAEVLARRLIKQ